MSQAEAMNAPKPKRGGLVGVILKWGEFVKFSHTIFAMPFALGEMMVASREHYRYLEEAKADLPAPATEYGFPVINLFSYPETCCPILLFCLHNTYAKAKNIYTAVFAPQALFYLKLPKIP